MTGALRVDDELPVCAVESVETVIDVPLSTLQKEQFAINGHKSAAEASTYVFCGNIGPQ